MQKFWDWCCHYQEIYDWISSFNKQSGFTFILTQQSFEALKKVVFAGLHFYTLSKTLIACRALQLRVLKVETLLNNAFNLVNFSSSMHHEHLKENERTKTENQVTGMGNLHIFVGDEEFSSKDFGISIIYFEE